MHNIIITFYDNYYYVSKDLNPYFSVNNMLKTLHLNIIHLITIVSIIIKTLHFL